MDDLKNTYNDIDELIARYLAGEASGQERLEVESWIDEHEQNRRHFRQLQTIFETAAAARGLQQYDTDKAWTKVKAQLAKKPEGRTVHLRSQIANPVFWLRIAASITLITAVGYLSYRLLSSEEGRPVQLVASNTTTADSLPDGTRIVLNKQTEVEYAFDPQRETHTVRLAGEAFFDIKPDIGKTFIVEANGVIIRDIGTAFNVKAYADQKLVEVSVEEGEVMFFTHDQPGIHLVAGEQGVYDRTSNTFSRSVIPPNVTAYKDRVFVFNNSDLRTVVDDLNSVYDTKIVIPAHLHNCHVTVSFQNEKIEEIAIILAETLGLQIEAGPNEIKLEGQGCE